jgi:hypothetical protein
MIIDPEAPTWTGFALLVGVSSKIFLALAILLGGTVKC